MDLLDYYELSEILEMFGITDEEILEMLIERCLIDEEDVLRRLTYQEQEETEETEG